MQYISGMICFGIQCECDSVGCWNMPKSMFLDDANIIKRESDGSLFGSYGIEKNKFIPYREYTVWNIADHVRAYMDMLADRDYEKLKGVFANYISSAKCRKDIFTLTLSRLGKEPDFMLTHQFMVDEFGADWLSFCDAVKKNADHLSKHREEINSILEAQRNPTFRRLINLEEGDENAKSKSMYESASSK